jgi:hypothetical protein
MMNLVAENSNSSFFFFLNNLLNKVGGEVYFSDTYTDREIPDEAKKDQEAWGQ